MNKAFRSTGPITEKEVVGCIKVLLFAALFAFLLVLIAIVSDFSN